MYKTKADIINWIKNFDGVLETETDLAKFAAELGDQVKQMDFRAKNGGAAIAYSGWFGNEAGVQSQIFRTDQNISEHSQDNRKVFFFAQNPSKLDRIWESVFK
ncbi:hypothetical protein, partial [Streptococcus sp. DD11]|uniref:hypothetical protein n=1 Tax=Streptococcus sp. DD11 TaxID=1777879 RepID=UPI0013E3E1F0